MSLENRRLQFYLVLVLADVVVLLGSFALAATIHPGIFSHHDAMLPAYLMLPLFQTIAFYNGTYSRDGLTNWRSAAGRAIIALAVSALMFNFFAFFAKANADFSRAVFIGSLAATAVGLTATRWGLARFIVALWGPSVTNRLLIDAGGPDVRIPNVYRVNARDHGLRPDLEDPLALDRLSKYLRNMDTVIVSCSQEDRLAWSEVLRGSGIHGEVISDFAQEIGALAIVRHEEADVTALVVSRGHLGIRARITKRLFDIAVSLVALLALSPVLLACALAIRLDDNGPVFFRQRRMGRGNQFFDIFKFRSMRVDKADANGNRSAAKDDDRITRVGRFLRKTSLDELPQLLNVLKGDMSTVDPRLSPAQPDPAVHCRLPCGVPHSARGEIAQAAHVRRGCAMIFRIGWIAALLGLALVTTFAQMDRSSRFNPALAPLVAEPFRGFSQARLTEIAVQAQDGPRARELARDLVRVRPIPAENLTLLSQASLLSGDLDGGLGALELAGTRGWREPFSQRAMAQAALLSGNPAVASQRIAALMATSTLGRDEIEPLVVELTRTDEGRAALAARLGEQGHWQDNFVGSGHLYLDPVIYADTIVRAVTAGAKLDCENLVRAERALRRSGHEDLADRISPGTCPAA